MLAKVRHSTCDDLKELYKCKLTFARLIVSTCVSSSMTSSNSTADAFRSSICKKKYSYQSQPTLNCNDASTVHAYLGKSTYIQIVCDRFM